MPSLEHALTATYIHQFVRRRPSQDPAVVATAVRADRRKERPLPPKSLRARVGVQVHGSVETFVLSPRAAATGPRVVYLHGGGYVSDIAQEHWGLIDHLGEQTGATMVVPRYRLAPESTWRDSWDALLDLAGDDGGQDDGEPTILAGDSAGGGLALALAQRLVANGTPPAGLALIAPWVDLTLDPRHGTVADDPWLDPGTLRACGRLWAGGDDPARPELSPLHGELAGLPPTLVVSGTRDVLHPANVELVRRLGAASVQVESVVGEGLIHVYPVLSVPEAKPARGALSDFISSIGRA